MLGPRVWELGAGGLELGIGNWEAEGWGPVVFQEAGSQALSFWQVHGGEHHLSLSQ